MAACGPPQAKGPNEFARHAAFDLDCPWEQLDFIPLKKSTPQTWGVKGCHKRATYSEVCSIAMYGMLRQERCTWIMNGPLQVEAAAPEPAAAPAPSAAPAPAPSSAPAPASSGVPVSASPF